LHAGGDTECDLAQASSNFLEAGQFLKTSADFMHYSFDELLSTI
jgi:hypothetical protein